MSAPRRDVVFRSSTSQGSLSSRLSCFVSAASLHSGDPSSRLPREIRLTCCGLKGICCAHQMCIMVLFLWTAPPENQSQTEKMCQLIAAQLLVEVWRIRRACNMLTLCCEAFKIFYSHRQMIQRGKGRLWRLETFHVVSQTRRRCDLELGCSYRFHVV